MSILSGFEAKVKKVLAVIEQDGKETVHVVTVIGNGCELISKLLVQGKQLEPEVKEQLTAVIEKGEAVAVAITAASAAGGANWTADAAAVAAVEQFVPVMVSTLKVLKADAEEFLPEIKAVADGGAPTPLTPQPAQ